MRKIIYVLLSAAAVIGVTGCSSTPTKEKLTFADCVFPGSNKAAPGWICDQPVEGIPVAAMGSAAKSDAGLDFMKQMAATGARVQLAQNMKVQVQNMIKQYVETTGAASKETVDRVNTSVTKQITDQSLQGTKILQSRTGPDGTLYVLVGLDTAAAQQLTEAAIKTSMGNDQAAWQQFRAQKGQDELAADIAKQRVEFEKQKN
ncbi:MAG: LPP20 family lipoprotein [Burkholderiaceae bacterium]|nr:LPP20 family lipoprotein [Burkholderiaceae bacterium]